MLTGNLYLNRPRERHAENKFAHVFLAGTIDMGNSADWQQSLFMKLYDHKVKATVYNPRRLNWSEDEAEIDYQIRWELERLNQSHVVFFNFEATSKSPVTMLELGVILASKTQSVVVVCPKAFYRHQNVKITCEMHGVHVHESIDSGFEELVEKIKLYNLKDQKEQFQEWWNETGRDLTYHSETMAQAAWDSAVDTFQSKQTYSEGFIADLVDQVKILDELRSAVDEGRASIIVEGVVATLDKGEIFTDFQDAIDAIASVSNA